MNLIIISVNDINDIINGVHYRDAISKYHPKLLYYYNGRNIDKYQKLAKFIVENVYNGVGKTPIYKNKTLMIKDNRKEIADATHILTNATEIPSTAPLYIIGNSGTVLTNDVPIRTLNLWDDKRYPYKKFVVISSSAGKINEFVTNIRDGATADNLRPIIIINGLEYKKLFSNLPLVRKSSIGDIFDGGAIHIVVNDYTLGELHELLYYTEPKTLVDNVWLGVCKSYNKDLEGINEVNDERSEIFNFLNKEQPRKSTPAVTPSDGSYTSTPAVTTSDDPDTSVTNNTISTNWWIIIALIVAVIILIIFIMNVSVVDTSV